MLFSCLGPSDERGAVEFNADLVADTVDRMGEIVMAGCTDCLDDGFAAEMTGLMKHGPEKAMRSMEDCLPRLRMSSALVERAHLWGQELKPAKSRGVAQDLSK